MKKMIAFLMALCMALTASAAVAQRAVLQDEQAPALISVDGVAATIVDANGNTLVQLTDAGLLQMQDIHQRTQQLLPETARRLSKAYELMMTHVHFSAVASAISLENLKAEINAALASRDMSAYNLMMFELFDVTLLGENAAALKDGAVLEFTVKPNEMGVSPLLVAFSPDGESWQLLDDYTANADGSVTLRLPANGVVSFILNVADASVPGSYETQTIIQNPSTTATVDEITPNFTPSVSGKPAPMVITTVDENNEVVVANIKYTDNADVLPIGLNDGLVVTPVSESAYVMDIQTHEHLQWSFDSILEAENISHIRTGIGAEIDGVLAAGGYGLTHFDMVVRDLFEITVYGDHVEEFYKDNAYLEIKFDAQLAQDAAMVVIFSDDSHNWHVLPESSMQLEADGTLTLKLKEMGTVAFLVERADKLTNVTVKSPE